MTMNFITVEAGIVSLLGAAAASQYRVLGYQEQNVSADYTSGTDRLVQVCYKRGEFPRSSSGRGPFDHQMEFDVLLTCTAAAECDLSVLENPLSTPGDIATALAAAESASQKANESINELFDLVYQVLMSGPNIDLGLGFNIGSRWVPSFEKGDVYPRGEHAVLTGTMQVTCRVDEAVPTATKVLSDDVDVSITHQGDAVVRAGVKVDN